MLAAAVVSVVVPIFNERENLPELRRRVVAALDATGESWELILVDDGSRDGSAEIIRAFHRDDPRVKLVGLSRNFGHQPAVTAGVHHARGDAVVLIDGDLQDPPEVIPAMVARWRDEGYQVVLGERTSRADRGVRGLGMRLFYPVLRRVTDLPDAASAGIFGLMDRAVVDHFNRLPERGRFIPGLREWLGFRRASVQYAREERAAGQPKQTLGRLVRYAADAMVGFSYKPLRAVTWLGVAVAGTGFAIALVFIVRRLMGVDPAVTGFTTLLVAIVVLGGVQLLSIGILGEYLGRVYEEVKQRPLYVVAETLGIRRSQTHTPHRAGTTGQIDDTWRSQDPSLANSSVRRGPAATARDGPLSGA